MQTEKDNKYKPEFELSPAAVLGIMLLVVVFTVLMIT